MKFNVTIKRTKVLRYAELRLYKLPSTLDANLNSTATVHINDAYSGKRLSTQRVSIATTGWIGFSLPLDMIRRWDRNPASNTGLAVQITESSMAPSIRFATRQTNPNMQLLLLLHCDELGSSFPRPTDTPLNTTPAQRRPRSVHSDYKGPCKRHKLNVNFKDLGWEGWVIAPKMYSAYYCAGTCQAHNSKMKTNHARIQLFLSQHDSDLANAPCCVPDQLDSIDMLFHGRSGESAYVLREMNEFVVQSCACY